VKQIGPEIELCRQTVKGWENLRLIYNGILLIAGGILLWRVFYLQGSMEGLSGGGLVIRGNLVVWSILFGIGANVCFCLGPYTEFIVIALGFPLSARKIRYFLFALGLLSSLGAIMLVWGSVEFSVSRFSAPPGTILAMR